MDLSEVRKMIETFFIAAFVVISAYIDYEHLRDKDYIESHVSWVTQAHRPHLPNQ